MPCENLKISVQILLEKEYWIFQYCRIELTRTHAESIEWLHIKK